MSTVAALVVTNRPAFIPWWTHQIEKQTRQPDKVIVIDNRTDMSAPWLAGGCQGPLGNSDPEGAFYYSWHVDPSTSLGEMRQIALDRCDADIILWFDDDDWYHPRRVELLVEPIERGVADASAMALTHRLLLDDLMMYPMPDGLGLHFPATAWRRSSIADTRFQSLATGEDCHWIRDVMGLPEDGDVVRGTFRKAAITYDRVRWIDRYNYPQVGAMVLVHGRNAWQKLEETRVGLTASMATPLYPFPTLDVSRAEWEKTRELLLDLRAALRSASA
jgi:hypothetical protein